MGSSCSSCCRRQKKIKDDEAQPLLHDEHEHSDEDNAAKARETLEHWSAILAAFKAGKLPSQEQLNDAVQTLLRSGVLERDAQAVKALGVGQALNALSETSTESHRPTDLDEQLSDVLLDVKGLLEVGMQFGLEKNNDDLLQSLVYHLQSVQLPSPSLPSSPPPSQNPLDLLSSLSSLLPLLASFLSLPALTALSSTAAQISSTANTLTHEAESLQVAAGAVGGVADIVGGLASEVSDVGRGVQGVAGEVGEMVGDVEVQKGYAGGIEEVEEMERDEVTFLEIKDEPLERVDKPQIEITKAKVTNPDEEDPEVESTKFTFLAQLEALLTKSHANPQTLRSLQHLLDTVTQFVFYIREKLENANRHLDRAEESEKENVVALLDPEIERILKEVKTFLGRLALSNSNTDSVLDQVSDTTNSIVSSLFILSTSEADPASSAPSSLQRTLSTLHTYLATSLSSPAYPSSAEGKETISEVYDSLFQILSAEENLLARNTRRLIGLWSTYITLLKSDRTSRSLYGASTQLYRASNALLDCISSLSSPGQKLSEVSPSKVLQSAMTHLFPLLFRRLLRALKKRNKGREGVRIPVPRVEFVSSSADIIRSAAGDDGDLEAKAKAKAEVETDIAAAIDALLLRLSLHSSPDKEDDEENDDSSELKIRISNHSDVLIDVLPSSSSLPNPNTSLTSQTTRIHAHLSLPSLSLHIRNVAYFARVFYSARWVRWANSIMCFREDGVGFEDEGVVSVDIGGVMDKIEADIDIEVSSNPSNQSTTHAKCTASLTLPTPTFHLSSTQHPFLAALCVRPLGGSLVKWFLTKYLERQVESVVGAVVERVVRVGERATEMNKIGKRGGDGGEVGWGDVWGALVHPSSHDEGEEVGESGDIDEQTESHTRVSTKGIVRTTATTTTTTTRDAAEDQNQTGPTSSDNVPIAQQNTSETSQAPDQVETEAQINVTESTLAIGIAPQIIPDKADPIVLVPSSGPAESSSNAPDVKSRRSPIPDSDTGAPGSDSNLIPTDYRNLSPRSIESTAPESESKSNTEDKSKGQTISSRIDALPISSITDVAKDINNEIIDTAKDAARTVREGMEEVRRGMRKGKEREREFDCDAAGENGEEEGWRSRVFDLNF